MNKINIVIPIYNEEQNIIKIFNDILALDLDYELEIIFVNDGSTDSSLQIIKKLSEEHSSVKYISFSRNFGHQPAVSAGLEYAKGDIVSIIDADLQDPPNVIVSMIEEWKNGAKVVYGVRKNRKESIYKKIQNK